MHWETSENWMARPQSAVGMIAAEAVPAMSCTRWLNKEQEKKEEKRWNRILMGITSQGILLLLLRQYAHSERFNKRCGKCRVGQIRSQILPMNRIMTAVLRAANWIILSLAYFFCAVIVVVHVVVVIVLNTSMAICAYAFIKRVNILICK